MSTPSRVRVRTVEYRIPFVRPLVTAAGIFHERRGFWILATDEDGRTGLGEVAPLPGGASEAIDEARRWLDAFARKNRVHEGGEYGIQEDTGVANDGRLEPPVVRAGMELAFLDLAAQREGVRVCDLLAAETGAIDIRDAVSCNALLREVDPAALAEEAAAAVAAGYRTVKVKIGAGTPEMDVRRIAAVRKSVGPGIHLRADANGAWDVRTAIRVLHELEPFDLEYVEQPTATDLAALRGKSRVRIAADESVDSMASAETLIGESAVDFLILKPMAIGGACPAAAIARRALRAGIGVVVTSILDTAVGVAGALHLAAILPASGPACGLATLDLFRGAPTTGLGMPIDGSLALPERPGLGVHLSDLAE